MKPLFFRTPADLRDWLAKNHDRVAELWVGLYKKDSGKESITWPESVDEALCFGWIDGVRKSVDPSSYMIRFTPRQAKSYWSKVNIGRALELIAKKRMAPAGLAAFEARDEGVRRYSFERESAAFDAALERTFRAARAAWTFFEAQPPGYRRLMKFYVMSAKKEETRKSRLARLIEASARGERL